MLEIARAALADHPQPKAIELRDVFFLNPFDVAADAERTMHIRVERSGEGAFTIFGADEKETFVTGKARYVEQTPAPRVDLDGNPGALPRAR